MRPQQPHGVLQERKPNHNVDHRPEASGLITPGMKSKRVGYENHEPMISNSTSPFRQKLPSQAPAKKPEFHRNTISAMARQNSRGPMRDTKSPMRHTIQRQPSLVRNSLQTTAQSSLAPRVSCASDIKKERFFTELLVIFREFARIQHILKDSRVSHTKKQLVDPDKWQAKFKTLLEKEKILNFDKLEGSQIFAKKGIMTSLEPKVTKPLGKVVLDTSPRFWILFTHYNKTKFSRGVQSDIDQKVKVRRQIVDAFFQDQPWTQELQEQQELLKKHLDDLLYLPDIMSAELRSQMTASQKEVKQQHGHFGIDVQSHIEPHMFEIQQEEEIVFMDGLQRFTPSATPATVQQAYADKSPASVSSPFNGVDAVMDEQPAVKPKPTSMEQLATNASPGHAVLADQNVTLNQIENCCQNEQIFEQRNNGSIVSGAAQANRDSSMTAPRFMAALPEQPTPGAPEATEGQEKEKSEEIPEEPVKSDVEMASPEKQPADAQSHDDLEVVDQPASSLNPQEEQAEEPIEASEEQEALQAEPVVSSEASFAEPTAAEVLEQTLKEVDLTKNFDSVVIHPEEIEKELDMIPPVQEDLAAASYEVEIEKMTEREASVKDEQDEDAQSVRGAELAKSMTGAEEEEQALDKSEEGVAEAISEAAPPEVIQEEKEAPVEEEAEAEEAAVVDQVDETPKMEEEAKPEPEETAEVKEEILIETREEAYVENQDVEIKDVEMKEEIVAEASPEEVADVVQEENDDQAPEVVTEAIPETQEEATPEVVSEAVPEALPSAAEEQEPSTTEKAENTIDACIYNFNIEPLQKEATPPQAENQIMNKETEEKEEVLSAAVESTTENVESVKAEAKEVNHEIAKEEEIEQNEEASSIMEDAQPAPAETEVAGEEASEENQDAEAFEVQEENAEEPEPQPADDELIEKEEEVQKEDVSEFEEVDLSEEEDALSQHSSQHSSEDECSEHNISDAEEEQEPEQKADLVEHSVHSEHSEHFEHHFEQEFAVPEAPSLLKKRTKRPKRSACSEIRKTRSMKRQQIDREISSPKKADCEEEGACFLKYEIVNKKSHDGTCKKVLLAKRCSMRNKSLGLQVESSNPLRALEKAKDVDMSIEYQSNEVEKFFSKDRSTQRVQTLAIQKATKVEIEDIEEVLGNFRSTIGKYSDSSYPDEFNHDLALIRVKAKSKKYAGLEKKLILAYLGKSSDYSEFISRRDVSGLKFVVIDASGKRVKDYIKCQL